MIRLFSTPEASDIHRSRSTNFLLWAEGIIVYEERTYSWAMLGGIGGNCVVAISRRITQEDLQLDSQSQGHYKPSVSGTVE